MAGLPTLRRAFLLLLAGVFLPLVLLPAGLLGYQWHALRERAFAELQEEARALRHAMDRELKLDIAVLGALSASRDLDHGDLAAFHEMARRSALLRPGSWVVLVDAAGQNVVNTAVPFGTPLPNLRGSLANGGAVEWEGRRLPLPPLDIFEAPLRTGRPAFSGLVYGRISQRPVVATNVPVLREGRASHVLGIAYSPDFYVGLLQAQLGGQAGLLGGILDGSGRLVARNLLQERFVGLPAPPPFERGTAHLPAEGLGETVNLEGQPTAFAYSRSQVNDWVAYVGIPKSALLAPAWNVLWVSLAVLLATIAVATFLASRLSRRIAVPLAALAERTRSDGAALDGIPATGIREIEALKGAMAAAAAARQERLRMEAERELARGQLQAAHEKLLESDRRKDDLLLMLGHELRNPLAAIGNAAEVLAKREQPDRLSARMQQIVLRQVRHLARITDDLLDVARVTHGRMTLRRQPLDLGELLRQVADDARLQLHGKDLQLAVEADAPVWVRGDATRLIQVFAELLDNAVKFTPDGGRVAVSLAREQEQAVVRVADTGVGIAPDLLPRLFDTFAQNPQAIDRSQGGLGLGLSVARGIVELHGGTIVARSEGEGHGAEFELRLPAVEPPVRSPPASP